MDFSIKFKLDLKMKLTNNRKSKTSTCSQDKVNKSNAKSFVEATDLSD